MNKKILFFSFTMFLGALLNSCGIQENFHNEEREEERTHKDVVEKYEKDHNDCLETAQTAEEKRECDDVYRLKMRDEEARHNKVKYAIQEKKECAEYQSFVLRVWGYSKSEADKAARDLSSYKGDDYYFDADRAIAELISNKYAGIQEYKDMNATEVFGKKIQELGFQKINSVEATKKYYGKNLYKYSSFSGYQSNLIENPREFRFGNNINVTKDLLVELEREEGGNSGFNDYKEGQLISNNDAPNSSDTGKDSEKKEILHTPYYNESVELSNCSVSKYGLNVVKLTPTQKTELDKVVAFMEKWPDAKITIVGHTCSIGSDAANETIGKERAHQAKLYMIAHGIDESRIDEISKAATEPCASNDTEVGRLQNRRITFVVK